MPTLLLTKWHYYWWSDTTIDEWHYYWWNDTPIIDKYHSYWRRATLLTLITAHKLLLIKKINYDYYSPTFHWLQFVVQCSTRCFNGESIKRRQWRYWRRDICQNGTDDDSGRILLYCYVKLNFIGRSNMPFFYNKYFPSNVLLNSKWTSWLLRRTWKRRVCCKYELAGILKSKLKLWGGKFATHMP